MADRNFDRLIKLAKNGERVVIWDGTTAEPIMLLTLAQFEVLSSSNEPVNLVHQISPLESGSPTYQPLTQSDSSYDQNNPDLVTLDPIELAPIDQIDPPEAEVDFEQMGELMDNLNSAIPPDLDLRLPTDRKLIKRKTQGNQDSGAKGMAEEQFYL
ncbi:MAG: hypothetical protein AAB833_02060 [Patescibacteria group bacterium]|mgnify:CR=1 FL=1